MKYKIEFTHTVEITYEAKVEAENKSEAKSKFYEDPFNFIKHDEVGDEQEIDIGIISIEELEEN